MRNDRVRTTCQPHCTDFAYFVSLTTFSSEYPAPANSLIGLVIAIEANSRRTADTGCVCWVTFFHNLGRPLLLGRLEFLKHFKRFLLGHCVRAVPKGGRTNELFWSKVRNYTEITCFSNSACLRAYRFAGCSALPSFQSGLPRARANMSHRAFKTLPVAKAITPFSGPIL